MADAEKTEDRHLTSREMRQVYLFTYSRANEALVSSRQQFVEKVVNAFKSSGNGAEVVQHVCAQERHLDGGIHYHMAIKLDRCQRWLHVRNRLQEDSGIRVHFSSRHSNYYAAWKYVTKEDVAYVQSEGHPDLADALPPRTARASEARTRLERPDNGQTTSKKRKTNRLTAYEVSQIAVIEASRRV